MPKPIFRTHGAATPAQETDPAAPGTVLLVSSSGGVILELMALRPWWERHRPVWAAVRAPDTASLLEGQRCVRWLPDLAVSRLWRLPRALLAAALLVRRERPGLVVSAGSGPAVPFFLVAAVRGIPAFWIATLNVDSPGISARICGRLASRVLVQREEQCPAYPGAVVLGELY